MTARNQDIIKLAVGQVWRGTDGDTRELLVVEPPCYGASPSVRVKYQDGGVRTISRLSIKSWIWRHHARPVEPEVSA